MRCDTDGGPQEPQWGTFVDADGNTKTKLPYDNVGVQYGLKALQEGVISPEEFVRLNEGVGGYDNDRVWSGGSTGNPTIPAPRMVAQTDVLPTIYKSGILADGKQLAKVAHHRRARAQQQSGHPHALALMVGCAIASTGPMATMTTM